MNKIFETPYFIIYHDDELNINIIRWTTKILLLNEQDYKEGIINAFQKVNETKADYLIIDNTDAVYPITETLQDWIIENIFPLNQNYKKVAYIYSQDSLTSMNIEEIVNKLKSTRQNIERRLFSSINEAIEWLIS